MVKLPAFSYTFRPKSTYTASVICFLLPLYVGIELFDMGVYFAWGCALNFVFSLFLFTWLRYRSGKWQTMSVI